MRITVRLFAAARDLAGGEERALELAPGSTVADVEAHLRASAPRLGELLPHCAFARDRRFVRRDVVLGDGDELAVLPPVSGG